MKALFRQKGAHLDISILATDKAQDFINTHTAILDSTFQKVEMSDLMRQRLSRSNYVFSGMKTFHELNEAFPSLLDENGDRKTFERFLNDVRSIDETYNRNYLRAEYNFVHQSAQMAAKWERFAEDGDRYYLQYRTAGDDKVRPEHAALDRVTLPMSDPFWETYYPPNGWNCRCSAVQVLKWKYDKTDPKEAMERGKEALDGERFNIFRFNSGKQQKAVPDYNPYTIRRCNDCDVAKGNSSTKLAFVPDNEMCSACRIVRACANMDAKQTKRKAKPLQGSFIHHQQLPQVLISKKSIKEWANQPYRHVNARMLLDIKNVFQHATYIGTADNHKNVPHLVQSHIFETEVGKEKAYIIVREYDSHEFILHSLSEGGKLLEHIKKK